MASLASIAAFVLASLLLAATALAAIDGALEPSVGKPGDWVALETLDYGDGTRYQPLRELGDLELFLMPETSPPTLTCEIRVGDLRWVNNVGTSRFRIPDVTPGRYWITALVEGSCWRFGDGQRPLVLTVAARAPDTSTSTVPLSTALVLFVLSALAAAGGLIGRRASRRRARHRLRG